ncbi:MOSC domain-containing protein [Sorangium cellulosum]|uniref:Molybdenum cofactor sulfurase n=1 Tax=Sorangium cellulosum TaxID=56 RepID=A0A150PXW8_SORCE|nr:MOSC domain-containing protein [Sorangium cellulosum]KYF60554.1 molybdenum cofactor sulfurase [Sorangium cellulosum]
MSQVYPLHGLLVGKKVPLGPSGQLSAIAKSLVFEPLRLSERGLEGDEQGDMVRHGGVEKALHHVPLQHYGCWEQRLGLPAKSLAAGAFGENISTRGLDESSVCVGDTWTLGSAVIQVSQGRQPCWKLNLRFSRADMARLLQESGWSGWYYRVLQPGVVAPQDELKLLHRPQPGWPIARLLRALHRDGLNHAELERMEALPELAPSWRAIARRRLELGAVEDFAPRLTTPSGL